MTKNTSDIRGDSFNIPGDVLEQFRLRPMDNASPFRNFARINLDMLSQLMDCLNKPERRVLLSMTKRMHARNMVMLTREEFRTCLQDDYGWSPDSRHLSTYLQALQDKQAIKELSRVTFQSDDGRRRDVVTYCIDPMFIFKGKGRQHLQLIIEWDNDEIVPPPRRRNSNGKGTANA